MCTDVKLFVSGHLDWVTRMKMVREITKQCITILQALEEHSIIHNGNVLGIEIERLICRFSWQKPLDNV